MLLEGLLNNIVTKPGTATTKNNNKVPKIPLKMGLFSTADSPITNIESRNQLK
jgi:hypothetical protein